MSVTRVSTYALHQNLSRDMSRTQADLANLQVQISSGLKANTFEGLDGQVEQFTDLTAKINKAKQYQQNNELTLSRFRTMGTALDELVQTASDIINLIVARRNPATGQSLAFTQQLQAKQQELVSQLNTTIEGRYLFGGTITDRPPVIKPLPSPVATGVPDNSYYQGSTENVIVNPQDNLELDTPVRADAEGFQKIFAATFKAITGDTQNGDALLADAQDLAQSAFKDILALKASLDAAVLNVQSINDQHQTLQLYWQGVSEQISKTDLLTASTQVSTDQAVLTATFQVFARVSSLRLSDYL